MLLISILPLLVLLVLLLLVFLLTPKLFSFAAPGFNEGERLNIKFFYPFVMLLLNFYSFEFTTEPIYFYYWGTNAWANPFVEFILLYILLLSKDCGGFNSLRVYYWLTWY